MFIFGGLFRFMGPMRILFPNDLDSHHLKYTLLRFIVYAMLEAMIITLNKEKVVLQYSLAISCTPKFLSFIFAFFLNFFVDINHDGNNLHIYLFSIKQPLTSHSLAWNSFNSRRHFWLRIVENECEYHITKHVLIICICFELVID